MTGATIQPVDAQGNPIPVLGYSMTDGAMTVAIGSASARNTTAFSGDTRVITVFPTVDCFIEQGTDTSVAATTSRHFLAGGRYYDIDIGGGSVKHRPYLAVIRASVDGTLYISERD